MPISSQRIFLSSFLFLSIFCCAPASAFTFSVTFDTSVRATPANGRLVVYLLRANAPVAPMHQPADGFVEEDPQPMYGIDVTNVAPGQSMIVDDAATSFPVNLSALPAGQYRVQAVLDMSHENSDWHREPGNLFSEPISIDSTTPNGPIDIKLAHVVVERKPTTGMASVEIVRVRSKLLSDFRGRDVFLRAGVALPVDYDAKRSYAAVYEVPGYGGDERMAYFKAYARARRPRGSAADDVAHNLFWIFLDPESPNGHTLFADSECNGPCTKALITELIPEIERKFHLVSDKSARIITGHSSGGWSSLWLATEYPDTFGSCWSSSPDPVDFRKLELVDIYGSQNFYADAKRDDLPGARFDGKVTMTVRQENGMEQVLGPRNDSAQQWDSWQGVWGHRGADGNPKPLYDPISGTIDHAEAESYRRFDIADRLRKDPKRFVPIFRNNIRVVCGTEDTYYLNEAVKLLQDDLEQLDPSPKAHDGYIKLAPGDHQSVSESKEVQNWSSEMMAYLRANKLAPAR